MPEKLPRRIPPDTVTSTAHYTVPFFDTDAMGIVHHANYVRYLELGRVRFLQEHDQPYTRYLEAGYHVAVIGVETAYHQPSRFADELEIVCWLSWIRAASLGFQYVIQRGGQLIVSGRTDHAFVNSAGRAVRMPSERRDAFARFCRPTPKGSRT